MSSASSSKINVHGSSQKLVQPSTVRGAPTYVDDDEFSGDEQEARTKKVNEDEDEGDEDEEDEDDDDVDDDDDDDMQNRFDPSVPRDAAQLLRSGRLFNSSRFSFNGTFGCPEEQVSISEELRCRCNFDRAPFQLASPPPPPPSQAVNDYEGGADGWNYDSSSISDVDVDDVIRGRSSSEASSSSSSPAVPKNLNKKKNMRKHAKRHQGNDEDDEVCI